MFGDWVEEFEFVHIGGVIFQVVNYFVVSFDDVSECALDYFLVEFEVFRFYIMFEHIVLEQCVDFCVFGLFFDVLKLRE